ncbi:segregation and condensation protein A [Chondromyces apiculatus]|uniref:Segregation and condensation protein A n=1 Tax=Chondromyces apiculatus DSM 436 TaxID=1192034 RepID=A0A017SXJ4_9BACT|nr:segregation/condensation protein A [Chondromyces apiculatus]EYF01704.1 Segregation and condensation protein A [Chondromyces apiculatus DSM 436]
MKARKESAARGDSPRTSGRATPTSASARNTVTAVPRGAAEFSDKAPAHVEPEQPSRDGEYVIHLPSFEGPLDLLLHLIQKHELDILDIPVSFITEKYLEYLNVMKALTIDLASEYLVMAATLAHIKSKMLLPVVPAGQDDDGMPGDEEEDPRAELVRRLLEYQKYKAAAEELSDRGTLGRDIFTRGMSEEEVPQGPAPFAAVNAVNLLDAFEKILKRTNVRIDHEVTFDRISITDRILEVTDKLSARRAMTFEALLLDGLPRGAPVSKFEIVITFLAVLEMCKLKLLRVHQVDPLSAIYVELSVQDDAAQDILTTKAPHASATAVASATVEGTSVQRPSPSAEDSEDVRRDGEVHEGIDADS